MNWKNDYISWYRLVETGYGNLVPYLSDHDIVGFVSSARENTPKKRFNHD